VKKKRQNPQERPPPPPQKKTDAHFFTYIVISLRFKRITKFQTINVLPDRLDRWIALPSFLACLLAEREREPVCDIYIYIYQAAKQAGRQAGKQAGHLYIYIYCFF
jgi:hypothetical protein